MAPEPGEQRLTPGESVHQVKGQLAGPRREPEQRPRQPPSVRILLGVLAEADDVAQEAFVTAYRKLAGFRGEAAFRTWILAITWRRAIDRRTSLTRWMKITAAPADRAENTPDIMDSVPSKIRSQEDELAGAELQRTLKRLIGTLPKKLRDALLLAGSGEYSYEQIGEMLGAPVGTVKWRVSEARKMLKLKLTALGYADSAPSLTTRAK